VARWAFPLSWSRVSSPALKQPEEPLHARILVYTASLSRRGRACAPSITAKASGNPDFWGRGESEVAMKKLFVGVLLASALLFAQMASAGACGYDCQSFSPCYWACQDCVAGSGGPGYWIGDGECWGDIVDSTCGEYGQCGQPRASNWYAEPVVDQGVNLERCAQSLPALMPTAPPIH
jgi:hypothetical protein